MMAPWLGAQLRQIQAQPGHAWLLRGASGLGQYSLALGLISAWLCDRPGPEGACGACASCHQVAVRSHTDLCVLMPETVMLELGWPLDEKSQKELDEKKRKPSKEIRVDAMREAVEFAQRTSGRGRGKAVLVYPAERMNTVTANALLKTLEEPSDDLRFVLATEAAHLLLPTIRSRCLAHAMAWPTPDAALAWLQERGLDAAGAAALLRAAGGRPEAALRLHESGADARTWALLPQAMRRGDAAPVSRWAPALVLDALLKLCHDQMALRAGAPPRYFLPAELGASAATWEALAAWSKSLTRTARTVEHPFAPGLMLEALVSEACTALNS